MECLWVLEPDAAYGGLNNKHDKGYKHLLSTKRVFIQLLKSFVDQDWVNKIDEESAEKIDKSFILQDFSGKEADLVYKIKINGREVFFYILIELQSTVDYQMPYRLLQYMLEIWRAILRDTEVKESERKDFKLPVIVPCVLYNGQYNWRVCTNFKETLVANELFDDYILDFNYILFDVARYSEEDLLKLGNLIGAVFYIDQKPQYEEMIKRLNNLVEHLKMLSDEDFKLFRVWLKNVAARGMTKEETGEIEKIIDENEEAGKMVYAVEIAIRNKIEEMKKQGLEEGFKEGIEKGIEKGFEKGINEGIVRGKIEVVKNLLDMGMDIEQISIATGFPKENIQEFIVT
ncbi:MAG TPA: Rpn family recombination-promoting nuclease/putative transposase [Clostridiales bacterium]|nr:Rpn family recombination-promoting nuclease/putative transposase [Clostridiales bacterium]